MSGESSRPQGAPAESARTPYLVPLAILAGFGMVAAAVYFGLRDQGRATAPPPEPAVDLSLPEAERGAWVKTPTPPPDSSAPLGEARPPAEVHTPSAFGTQWNRVREAVAKTCEPTTHVTAQARSYHIELPLTLQIAADGRITGARPFAKMRDVRDDGTHRAATIKNADPSALTQCYATQIAERIRFAPATSGGELEVWVRVLSSVD